MDRGITSAFAVRLRDLLSTLESAALVGSSESRLRGLGEQLQFACMALPCDEALVAVELHHLGILSVPGVADAAGWRTSDLEFPPSGTPFAFLLGGGTGYAMTLAEEDEVLAVLRPVLQSEPRHAAFVPIRLGARVIGGGALFRADEPLGDHELSMAERLAEVLALTMEAFRTERVLLELFAEVLPDLCAPDAATNFAGGLERYIHTLRLTPEYRRRLELADAVGRIAAHGTEEARLVADVLTRMEGYIRGLEGARDEDGEPEGLYDTDELYD